MRFCQPFFATYRKKLKSCFEAWPLAVIFAFQTLLFELPSCKNADVPNLVNFVYYHNRNNFRTYFWIHAFSRKRLLNLNSTDNLWFHTWRTRKKTFRHFSSFKKKGNFPEKQRQKKQLNFARIIYPDASFGILDQNIAENLNVASVRTRQANLSKLGKRTFSSPWGPCSQGNGSSSEVATATWSSGRLIWLSLYTRVRKCVLRVAVESWTHEAFLEGVSTREDFWRNNITVVIPYRTASAQRHTHSRRIRFIR